MKSLKLSQILFSLFALVLVALACVFEPLGLSSSETLTMAAGPAVAGQGRLRAIWGQLMNHFDKEVMKQIITASYLRSERRVTNTTGVYEFELLSENANPRPTERRLDKNDVFIATHLGFYLVQNPVATGVEQYVGIPQTYNNATGLTGSANVVHLAAFWQGRWSIKVGSTVFFASYPCHLCWMAPDTQQSAANNRSARTYSDGAPIIEPNPVFSGSNSNEVSLTIPIFQGFAGADTDPAATLTYAVFNPFGFLIKNGANYLRKPY